MLPRDRAAKGEHSTECPANLRERVSGLREFDLGYLRTEECASQRGLHGLRGNEALEAHFPARGQPGARGVRGGNGGRGQVRGVRCGICAREKENFAVRLGITVSISGFHPGDPGSIPGDGVFLLTPRSNVVRVHHQLLGDVRNLHRCCYFRHSVVQGDNSELSGLRYRMSGDAEPCVLRRANFVEPEGLPVHRLTDISAVVFQ